jgi:DinB superfamily
VKRTLAVVCVLVCVTLAQAQNATKAAPAAPAASTAAPTKDPVATAARLILQRFQNNTIGAIEAMPADKFNYKPTADQITFGHLAAHIASSNDLFCSKAADVPAPKVDEPKETDSKDQLVAAVKASFTFCSDALGKMDDSKLGDTIELFPGRQLPRSVAVLAIASSMSDHYAAAAMYLRLNNILPPSAQPKK